MNLFATSIILIVLAVVFFTMVIGSAIAAIAGWLEGS